MKTPRSALAWGREVASPVGPLTLLADEQGLTGLYFAGRCEEPWEAGESAILSQAEEELDEYFAGRREVFSVSCAARGTDFQRAVWQVLATIPFGETWSYQAVAQAIGQPTAVRAVGLANGANPISIIVPCHRVIGANGRLTGFGGGLERKRFLLNHEQRGELC
ncbi:methylated-DNA--[protein]-cysteine S-methyltransferase [Roseibacillus ishigakijimensis]|uniref:Methylated-DNA--protein-cysteine methyltransferase n=1 Tax=Roseibacillus ishigakijimensis TaxID=454146 RepID=A0A934RU77_9BACT|nr:methylated-DNA--[protein]-cysteine S-methyltransferase [Roseibacillus ishigakijimensis]MBK1834576.1 methylated-DNA--[protein]-cysteine S-methyltransferase [Roseibacillus ishigakijimensis]